MSSNTNVKEEVRIKVEKPRMYKVYLINDDYTTMDFVVEVIVKVFNKTVNQAEQIMIEVHKTGIGFVGTYTYDIAATKIMQVEIMAKERGFPLKARLEME